MLFRDLMHQVERENNIAVSLEVCDQVFLNCEELKLAPDQYLHHTSFCRAAKQHDGNKSCGRNKAASIKLARKGHFFCGICPFGIMEFVAPVRYDKHVVAILYLGGMASPEWQKPEFFHGEAPRPAEKNWYVKLRRIALFLCRVLEMELRALSLRGAMDKVKRRDDNFYVQNCQNFIRNHYQKNIALADLADLLGVNPNYLGGVLRKKLHTTFREQLTQKRLDEAEILLRFHSGMSVGEIAFKCGFSDSNYFSALFRRKRGLSPTEFRAKAAN